VIASKPLPAHWALSNGLGEAESRARDADAAFWKSAPASARRARDKAASEAAGWGGYSGEAAELVKRGTSPTAPDLEAAKGAALSALGDQPFEVDPQVARCQRMSKMTRLSLKAHKSALPDWPVAFYTLNHRPGEKPDSRDVSKFLDRVRLWLLRKWKCRVFRYAWVAELQIERAKAGDPGAVHYHIAIWLPPEILRRGREKAARNPHYKDSMVLPKADKSKWWGKGGSHRDWVRKSVIAYMASYMTKGDEGKYPKGVRIHASGGFNSEQRMAKTHAGLPRWIRQMTQPQDRACRAKGGGWLIRSTGEHLASPFWCLGVFNGRPLIVRVTDENYDAICDYSAASARLGQLNQPRTLGMARLASVVMA
jgi:hypothetical protein